LETLVRARELEETGGAGSLPPLEQGDRLDRETFHARYCAMPPRTRAELIDGVVIMPSPLFLPHSDQQVEATGWLYLYKSATPGVILTSTATTLLNPETEVQPDLSLLIEASRGGQTRQDVNRGVIGAPELVMEIASSSAAYDLHLKRDLYERAGVREYVVTLIREARVLWLARRGERFAELAPGADGLYRSEVFPGLWLDAAALLRQDTGAVRTALEQGLASPEHAAFVRKLGEG